MRERLTNCGDKRTSVERLQLGLPSQPPFYKTLNGAGVGDPFMSLIHTWELNGANPFEYLTALQRHP